MIRKLPVFFCLFFTLTAVAQWDDTDRLSAQFHASRREALRQLMPAKSIAVFFSNPVRNRSNDVDYQYSQNPDFYYLSGYLEPNSMLLIFKEEQKINGVTCNEVLFVQPRNAKNEIWTGKRLGVEGAKRIWKIIAVFDNYEFENSSIPFNNMEKILVNLPIYPNKTTGEKIDLAALVAKFEQITGNYLDRYDPTQCSKYMALLREIKQPEELILMQKAINITMSGFKEMIRAVEPGFTEYQAQAIVEYYMKKEGSEYPGYPSIVGSGTNSCVLHYTFNRKKLAENDVLLIDMGAEYHGYTADITRTIPVNGRFSIEQRIIYQLVYDAQQAGINECKPGTIFRAPHNAAFEVIAKGLKQLGIIKDESEAKTYFMHGTSHYLGLDVHDAGTFGTLKTNSVITVEPGIYIPENSNCDKKWWNIGIRIEDDILITDTGHINMSGLLPSTIEGIEKLMQEQSVFNGINNQK